MTRVAPLFGPLLAWIGLRPVKGRRVPGVSGVGPPGADAPAALHRQPDTAKAIAAPYAENQRPTSALAFSESSAGFPPRATRPDEAAVLAQPDALAFADAGMLGDRPPRIEQLARGDGAEAPSFGPHGHRERMREKLLDRGADALADYELLEMLLFFAFKKGDTKPLAKFLIHRFGGLAGVLTATSADLLALRGLGPHSVAAIRLVQAAALRLERAQVLDQPVLNNWDRLMAYLNAVLARERVEQFRVLFLDGRNRLLADEAQARGTVNHTPVYPREVVKRALELHATAIILVHNHPSGDPTPSRDDIEMTRLVQAAATSLDVVLHDHVIIGNGRWLSLRQEGLMN